MAESAPLESRSGHLGMAGQMRYPGYRVVPSNCWLISGVHVHAQFHFRFERHQTRPQGSACLSVSEPCRAADALPRRDVWAALSADDREVESPERDRLL